MFCQICCKTPVLAIRMSKRFKEEKLENKSIETVAIYCRLSDEDRNKVNCADESESIQNQKSMLINYAIENGWDIYKIYCDEDYSGADITRPEFQAMINDCENGYISIVLCKTQSRFSRDMEIIEKYIHNKFMEWNIRFVSIVDHADTDVVGNKKSRQINGLINEWYLEDLSDNIRRTLKHKRQNGERTASFSPYGYIVDPDNKNHLIIDGDSSKVVVSIFNMYAGGIGYLNIVKNLNNNNVPNPSEYKRRNNSKYRNLNQENGVNGINWTISTIYTMLRNEVYIGNLVQGKTQNINYKNKKRKSLPKSDWIIVEGTHEAIIDIDIWDKVQSILKTHTRVIKGNGKRSVFSGKVKCLICGSRVVKNVSCSGGNYFNYLKCKSIGKGGVKCTNNHAIRLDHLEEEVIKEINNILRQYYEPSNIKLASKNQDSNETIFKEKKSIMSIVEKKENNLVKLYDDKLENIVTKDQYLLYSKKISDEIKSLKLRLKQLDYQMEIIRNDIDKEKHRKTTLEKYKHIDTLTADIVEEFINVISIGEKKAGKEREIVIDWKI